MGRKRYKFINELEFKEYRKQYKRNWKRNRTKYISISPENGREIDVCDMMTRNEERFKYGAELNR